MCIGYNFYIIEKIKILCAFCDPLELIYVFLYCVVVCFGSCFFYNLSKQIRERERTHMRGNWTCFQIVSHKFFNLR